MTVRSVPKPAPPVVDHAYRAWVRQRPCLLAARDPPSCSGYLRVPSSRYAIEFAHVRSRGARGGDHQAVPLCQAHHRTGGHALHRMGRKSFEQYWDLSLAREAQALWAQYQAEQEPFGEG